MSKKLVQSNFNLLKANIEQVLLHLKLLFQLIFILKHRFVPDSFAFGISIPLIKEKTGNLNDLDNYRAITLSSVISKLFEMVVLDICNAVLSTVLICYSLASKLVLVVQMRYHSVNSSSYSVNGDIAIQWEWSNFVPSQNPNPLTYDDKTSHN